MIEVDQGGHVLRSFRVEKGPYVSSDPCQLYLMLERAWYVVIDQRTDQCLVTDGYFTVIGFDSELRFNGANKVMIGKPSRMCLAGDRVLINQENDVTVEIL